MHKCYKNWQGTYIIMETDGIVAGFQKCVDIHGLKLIGDGDSSVHRRLIETLPYRPNSLEQKSECRNHILRNYGNRLRDICMKSNFENVELKSLIQENLLRLRTAVTKAVSYRKAQKKEAIFEVNPVPEMKANGIFLEILSAANTVSYHADSLIDYVYINCFELYNSHIAKAVGGKRINICLRQSYQVRCQSAVIAYNKKDELLRVIHKTLNNKSSYKKFTELKKKESAKKDNARDFPIADKDYGPDAAVPDMPSDQLEVAKEEYVQKFTSECIEEKRNYIESRRGIIFNAELEDNHQRTSGKNKRVKG
ncbi:hypothetical protein PR048_005547 [Dryococelus australis]|uniref:Mutator-like transposase domain-containing protein n=1 Tax=Dryococelus australis TaxID=614101 RepID=A0ABQ9I8M7_9NEOP|nr:hypothetical protein PR048_005547 [Dryococelus australis]